MTYYKCELRFFPFILIFCFLLISCSNNEEIKRNKTPISITFENIREVAINGYSGDAMEPHISRDSQILFFNNLNADKLPSGNNNDTNLHYATRIDDVTFEYVGEINKANIDTIPDQNELEGVPSLDKNNRLYFIYTGDYSDSDGPNYLRSIFYADFSNGNLNNIESIPNLKMGRPPNENTIPGELNFDAEIHYDGEELYFVEGIFSGSSFPDEANIGVAIKENGVFIVHPESENLFANINTGALEYAPSISTNNLELYFTRASGSVSSGVDFGVYLATRTSVSETWDNIEKIKAITGEFTEAPSISYDGRLLYFHKKVGGIYKIYMVDRIE